MRQNHSAVKMSTGNYHIVKIYYHIMINNLFKTTDKEIDHHIAKTRSFHGSRSPPSAFGGAV